LLRHWLAGNSTIIDELFDDFEGSPPDAIVCSVGGGGLLNGIMLGLERYDWADKVTVLALETEGADCLSRSLQAGGQVTMQEITSIARSLGVSRVSNKTWDLVQQHPNIRSVVLRDADAARACVRFAEEQKMIVEPACGVCLAVFYDDLVEELIPGLGPDSKVVVIVCGGERNLVLLLGKLDTLIADPLEGSNIDVEKLLEYELEYGQTGKGSSRSRSTLTIDGATQVRNLGRM
jgi:L-serine/L-threonine ammonia-lyase